VSGLRAALAEYLQLRRAMGFTLERPASLLASFVAFAEAEGAARITAGLALAWATRPAGADPSWHAARLSAVRGFAQYLQALDPQTEVPPPGLLPGRSSRRAEPYLYSAADIAALMSAAQAIRSPLRAATYQALIGLLAVTGARVGEAIRLDRGDLDWGEGRLTVRHGKFGKSRQLPLHPTTAQALAGYAQLRDRHSPRPASPAFFISLTGTRLIYKNVHYTFHRLVQAAGLQPRSARCRPRIHDLRHSFAVATLISWYQDGRDTQPRLPLLSTYLGHVDPADTYWYLQAAPELLTLAAARLEAGPPPGEPR
jgi:integrase/recombinase XerD